MSDPNTRRRLPWLGLTWVALVAVHVVLQLLAPRCILRDPLLPVWARVSLLATEAVAIAILVLLAALPLRFLGDRLSPAVRFGVRSSGGALILIGLAASWSAFWLSGQFLDRQGLAFTITNFDSVRDYAIRVHPFLFYGGPLLLLGVAVAVGVAQSRWVLPARVETVALRLAGGGLALAAVTALGGEIGHRYATADITDEATGNSYSHRDLYRIRRDRNAGPLTHVLSRALGSKDPFEEDAAAAAPDLVRRPIVPMEQYLSTVDRDRLKRWNVIVVLIDSLRADQLKAMGGPREVMPALEALAAEGRVFGDCVSQASHTDYAAPAVFSSHYPLRSRDVYRYPKNPSYPRVMIYDVLHALGWRTALYSSQNEEWGQMNNYMQTGGLDVYYHSRTAGVSEEATKDRPAFSGTVDDAVTVSESMKWIDRAAGAPFFLYLNLQNSHLPYDVPADFPRRFAPRDFDAKISIGWYPKEKTDVVKNVYADSLAYVDLQLQRLFQGLKERGFWDRTIVVVCGDHGESFYEHGSAAHANGVYDEVMRVPLVMRAPQMEAGRDSRPAQLIDVAPGVFHLLGLPVHPSFQGENPFDPDPRPDRVRYVVCDTPWKTHIAVYRSGFKLIRDGDLGASILYDLRRDPGEKTDATAANPDVARDLRLRLAGWRRAQLDYYDNALRQSCEYPPVLR
ncbi:MAG TPA: sulfatase [Planctomycetota bacterium]|nr:sulfatase [Planctomycetota bacterium]